MRKAGPRVFPAAIITPTGPKRSSRCSPNSSSYSAAASELHRRLHFKTDRASVRRWAVENHLAPDTRFKSTPKPVKRWQVRDYGALWQYDATPHAFLPDSPDKQVLLDLLDDATRYHPGARLYPSETLLAHLDFLPRAFQIHGLPLALYVDYHSFFFTHSPDAFTQLGSALHFYGVALRYAPTPQAKGKIERRHDYWQKRLPPLLAADHIVEILGATPHSARAQALAESRSVLRPLPACPWWPYVWSQQTRVRVGDDGKVPVGPLRRDVDHIDNVRTERERAFRRVEALLAFIDRHQLHPADRAIPWLVRFDPWVHWALVIENLPLVLWLSWRGRSPCGIPAAATGCDNGNGQNQ